MFLFEALAEKSLALTTQESMTAETKTELMNKERYLQSVQAEKQRAESQHKEASERIKVLEKENSDLKAQLQAKQERESRRETNLYVAGNCTWYVKEKVPYIGGTWGNANQWLASAQNYGFETGDLPKQGAIGVSFEGSFGHVVYVESINKDGSVTISEMNAPVLGVVTERTVPSYSFKYIYT